MGVWLSFDSVFGDRNVELINPRIHSSVNSTKLARAVLQYIYNSCYK